MTEPAQHELILTLEAPNNMSNEEIVEWVKRLSLALDQLHVALGGSGLVIKDVKAYKALDIPERRCDRCEGREWMDDSSRTCRRCRMDDPK